MQQKAQLTAFTATVHFNDHRSQTETSREAFGAFSDISSELTNGIDIVWTYLVWFPGREIPEKQEITLSISASESEREAREIGDDSIRRIRRALFWAEEPNSRIMVIIDYTEVTWGIDVLNYIENELRKAFVSYNRLTEVLRFWMAALSPFLILLVPMGAAILYPLSLQSNISSLRRSALEALQQGGTFEQRAEEKLNFLVRDFSSAATGFDARFAINFTALLMILVAVILFIYNRKRSSLVLNRATSEHVQNAERRYERLWYGTIAAFFVGAIAGVAGNKLTALLDKFF